MKIRLLDILRCPACKAALTLHCIGEEQGLAGTGDSRPSLQQDIREGFLRCTTCPMLFPIIAGVPRMIRNAYEEYTPFYLQHRATLAALDGMEVMLRQLGSVDASAFDRRSNESFGRQWQEYQYEDRTWFKDDLGLRQGEFLISMDLPANALRGKLVLDAGCGNGKLTTSIASYGAEVVGMDLSRSVERAAAHAEQQEAAGAPPVHFVQGNILEPPFAPATFDHIHTSGVLHHTPDTWRAFDSFLALGKPGAHVYVQLYRRREPWIGIPNAAIRSITSRMPVDVTWKLCWHLVPAHTLAVRMVARMRGEATPITQANRRERTVSLFDNFSPRYQYRYDPGEVEAKFRAAGLEAVKDVTFDNEARHMVAFVGRKPGGTDAAVPVSCAA
ncbi:methyltransferase domain-containing protein [Roseomonas sp. CAU 1739]|uniref:methyltransferase domain-containing protein n=1 Tax=Roseomonas sp. CAU 1739 TaxID=3140364 RepID=UPI00325BB611